MGGTGLQAAPLATALVIHKIVYLTYLNYNEMTKTGVNMKSKQIRITRGIKLFDNFMKRIFFLFFIKILDISDPKLTSDIFTTSRYYRAYFFNHTV